MTHNKQWFSDRIMERVGTASEEAQQGAMKIAGDEPLTELDIETLQLVFDMVDSSKVR